MSKEVQLRDNRAQSQNKIESLNVKDTIEQAKQYADQLMELQGE